MSAIDVNVTAEIKPGHPQIPGELNLTDAIHRDALQILEQVGVNFKSARLRDLYENTGLAAYDETTGNLHILPELVHQALTTAPKRKDYWIPENSFGIGGTAPFLYDDLTGELVEPTLHDLARIATIANNSPEVDFMARGVLIRQQEVKVMDTMIEYCKKPIYAAAATEAGLARAKKIVDTRGGLTVQFSIINSPLTVIDSMIPSLLNCLEKKIPIYVSTMPMAGLTAPYSMSGLLTLTHAEALFGITLVQLVQPGLTVVHAGMPSIANIGKNYAVDLGLLSHNAANLLMEKVAARLNLPAIQSACTTSQDHPNRLSELEAKAGYALMKKYGFHQMRHAFGFLRELISFSIGKLEKHLELCRKTGPEEAPEYKWEDYDPEGLEAILRVGAGGNYMRTDHTLKNTGRSFLH
jgi:trimethylamine---corrinoid protein Co-methyltransferase